MQRHTSALVLAAMLGIPEASAHAQELASAAAPPRWAPPTEAAGGALIARLPLAFVENRGQWDEAVAFRVERGAMTAWFERSAVVLQLERVEEDRVRGVAVRMAFEGASASLEAAGDGRHAGVRNYFMGSDPEQWSTAVPAYDSVLYRELKRGIDLRVREHEGALEYDLLLDPGADLASFAVRCDGVERLEISADGSLVMHTALGSVRQLPPQTWQVRADGSNAPLGSRFRLLGGHRYGFEVPHWNEGLSLVIDPGLDWSTYFGGLQNDNATSVAVDAAGLVTVCGHTRSRGFPTTPGAYDRRYNGHGDRRIGDGFIARLDPSRTGADQLLWSTFLGGAGDDALFAVCLDPDLAGALYVAGYSTSDDFPTTDGAYDRTYNGSGPRGYGDAVIARFDPSQEGAAQLQWSTYLGGSDDDPIVGFRALAIHAAGQVTVAGGTNSADFPTSEGAYDRSYNGAGSQDLGDIFVSRLDPGQIGTDQLLYSTYLGGTKDDAGSLGIALDGAGVISLAFWTLSEDLPTTPGAYDPIYNGGISQVGDGAVARIDPAGRGAADLHYLTFLGSTGGDGCNSLTMDSEGVVTVNGAAGGEDFPTTEGAYDRVYNGNFDGFVAQLRLGGNGAADLLYSTFLGGHGLDSAYVASLDHLGGITVTGLTRSKGFPTSRCTYDDSMDGAEDIFVARLVPRGNGEGDLLYSTFLGGNASGMSNELVGGIDLGPEGFPLVVGMTGSDDFPTTPSAFDETANGNWDGFLTRLRVVSWSNYGAGWPGTGGVVPACTASDYPVIGTTIELSLENCAGTGTLAFLFAGVSDAQLATNRGGTLLVQPLVVLGFTLPTAGLSVPFPIPDDVGLCDVSAYVQVLVVDPGASDGLAFSEGLRLVLGG